MRKIKKLTEKQIHLLFVLSGELKYMKAKLSLAKILAKYPHKTQSKHLIINFAFNHAPTNIVEWLILRFSEAIISFLDPASMQLLNKELYTKVNRQNYRSNIKEIEYILNLRDEYIAHRMVNINKNSELQEKIMTEYGDIYKFLTDVINILKDVLLQLEERGLYTNANDLESSHQKVEEFTSDDLDKLVNLANTLIENK